MLSENAEPSPDAAKIAVLQSELTHLHQQLAQERQRFSQEKAALVAAPKIQDTGWSYLLAIILALMAPAIFIHSVKFNQQTGSLEAIEVEANPVLVLGYFSLIGAIIGAPTNQLTQALGKLLSGTNTSTPSQPSDLVN